MLSDQQLIGDQFEELSTPIPGPRSRELALLLGEFESRGVTYLGEDFPIFWEAARGSNVRDSDGNRYIDLTAAFGVANTGHTNAYVASALADQAVRLIHGMGDVHPPELKAQLLEALPNVVPAGLTKTILTSSGSEAVEAALKTAALYTQKNDILAFVNGYHGLSYGALEVCGIDKFRAPFAAALRNRTAFIPFPSPSIEKDQGAGRAVAAVREALLKNPQIGALILEPIQARGGCNVPPKGFLKGLRALCDEFNVVYILDEIYTGFGRTGAMFACGGEDVIPDILVLGKALAGGLPVAAAVGTPQVMDAWHASTGEALLTSTFLGNPMVCAAALANFGEFERLQLPAHARQLGLALTSRLDAFRGYDTYVTGVRGRGLMWGIQMRDAESAGKLMRVALQCGIIVLQSGAQGDVVALTPPLVITERQLYHAVDILEDILKKGLRG